MSSSTIDDSIRNSIRKTLQDLEERKNIEILYACESGSRAWGFASPDSDYDVRFIYRRPLPAYLSVGKAEDSFDEISGDLDLSGWDLRKAVHLLGRSNGALLEWIHSPIIYREAPSFRKAWQAAAREHSPRALLHHYRGMAKNTVEGKLHQERRRPKDYLYALRATLAGLWVLQGRGAVPVLFQELLISTPPEILQAAETLLDLKAQTSEDHRIEPIAALDAFLSQTLQDLTDGADSLNSRGPSQEILDTLLHSALLPPAAPPAPLPGRKLRRSDFSLKRVRRDDMLLFDAVAGSHAYGTALEGSDVDRRGIFVAPPGFLLGMETIDQVSDRRSDQVYYELGRFVDLACKSNPNILELLAMPEDCVKYAHPLFELLKPEIFLSRQCARTFGQYALGQIRKARGLKKKIRNPEPRKRREAAEFCFILEGQGVLPLQAWLKEQGLSEEECGLTSTPRAKDLFALYVQGTAPLDDLQGIFSPKDRDTLVFSSVSKEARPRAWMIFQQDAFQAHCKAHREYWQWVEERNPERFAANVEHGRGYDSKNLMHTFRLLDMAMDIACEGLLRVRRPNRDFLLQIRRGEFAYQELVDRAEEKLDAVKAAFASSPLPEDPDSDRAREVLLEIRSAWS